MNWKNRLKNYNFWISLFSAILLILQALKIEFDVAYINEIFTAVLGLLVVVGIISDPTRTLSKSTDETVKSVNDSSLGVVAQKNDEKTQEEKSLPIDQKSETDELLDNNNIEDVVLKLTQDLNEKIERINQLSSFVQANTLGVDVEKDGMQLDSVNQLNCVVNTEIINDCADENYDCNIYQEQSDLNDDNKIKCVDSENGCGVENLTANENTSYLNLY